MAEEQSQRPQKGVAGRIVLKGQIECLTGLHIGGGDDNMAIGVVNSTVIRDPLSRRPIIPGSSLKGKMRTLLAKREATTESPFLPKHDEDMPEIKRLFGTSPTKEDKSIRQARLQFVDSFLSDETVERLNKMDTDLYLTEIKYENTINRLTSEANPRQMERVPAGSVFDFRLVYLIETAIQGAELEQDLEMLCDGLTLLQHDYLGGHGSRGSGRIAFKGLSHEMHSYTETPIDGYHPEQFRAQLKEVEESALFATVVG